MAARKGSGFPFPAQPDPSSCPRSAPVYTTPYTDKELRKIDRRIKKRQEKLRRRYKEIHGRRVDWIDHFVEEGWLLRRNPLQGRPQSQSPIQPANPNRRHRTKGHAHPR